MANTMALVSMSLAYPMTGTEPARHGTDRGTAENYFIETASQSYVVGDLVYLDSNGTVAICTTATTNAMAQLNSAVLGLPDRKATGTTGALVPFQAIVPTNVYIMNVYHTTAASAVTAQTMLGARFNIAKQAAGIWVVDLVNSVVDTLPMVTVVGFPNVGLDTNGVPIYNAGVGDTYGLVAVRFRPTYTSTDDQLDACQLWA